MNQMHLGGAVELIDQHNCVLLEREDHLSNYVKIQLHGS